MNTAQLYQGNVCLNSADFFQNPYPTYQQLREKTAPYWLAHVQRTTLPGMWMFTRYADVAEILKTPAYLSQDITQVTPAERSSVLDLSMLHQDPPNHTRLRKLVAKYFAQQNILSFEPRIAAIADQLLAKMQSNATTDFMTAFAQPLPVLVIAHLMGIPATDHEKIHQWSNQLRQGFDSTISTQSALQAQQQATQELSEYFLTITAQRRQQPQDDLLTSLAYAVDAADGISTSELLGMCILLVFAGHETTTNLFGNGLLTLLQHPKQLEALKQNPTLLPSAIEEMLRFESPLQRATFRVTHEACVIGGKHLQAGEQICAVIGAANRDSSQFESPDTFDITRKPNKHLSFGAGIHSCLGVILARTEARIGFTKLLHAFPRIRLMEGQPDWSQTSFFRRLNSLPIGITTQ